MEKFKIENFKIDKGLNFIVILLLATLISWKAGAQDRKDQEALRLTSQYDALSGTFEVETRDLGFQLVFNSGSRYRGIFGWGWCSDLDASLEISKSGLIIYRGCDFPSGDIEDPRQAAKRIKKVPGRDLYQRVRGDGLIQVFSSKGSLIELKSNPFKKILSLELENNTYLVRSSYRSADTEQDIEVYSETNVFFNKESGFVERVSVSGARSFSLTPSYRGLLLAGLGTYHFQYDRYYRLILSSRRIGLANRQDKEAREYWGYRPGGGGVDRYERVGASREDRLLVMVKSSDGSEKLRIEARRGAEMHPAFVLYDEQTETIDVRGDQKTLSDLLQLIRS